MTHIPVLLSAAFAKHDTTPDAAFYALPRFVTHIDHAAVAAVTALYRMTLPDNGTTPASRP